MRKKKEGKGCYGKKGEKRGKGDVEADQVIMMMRGKRGGVFTLMNPSKKRSQKWDLIEKQSGWLHCWHWHRWNQKGIQKKEKDSLPSLVQDFQDPWPQDQDHIHL